MRPPNPVPAATHPPQLSAEKLKRLQEAVEVRPRAPAVALCVPHAHAACVRAGAQTSAQLNVIRPRLLLRTWDAGWSTPSSRSAPQSRRVRPSRRGSRRRPRIARPELRLMASC